MIIISIAGYPNTEIGEIVLVTKKTWLLASEYKRSSLAFGIVNMHSITMTTIIINHHHRHCHSESDCLQRTVNMAA